MLENVKRALAGVALPVAVWASSGRADADSHVVAASAEAQDSKCSIGSLRERPDVRLTSATEQVSPVPHCQVAGVIGTETSFELLLPDEWNGKFVMGGGGGFVGSVINTALGFGVLQKGYATVGTDTGHPEVPEAPRGQEEATAFQTRPLSPARLRCRPP